MRNFIFPLLLLFTLQLSAQRQCVTSEYRSELFKDPFIANAVLQTEKFLDVKKGNEILSSAVTQNSAKGIAVIKIPVVVHVLYNKAEENISYQQILSQIEILNKDFRNRNQANPSGLYANLSADSYIEFQLATIDPYGNPTSGIVRKKTDIRFFNYDDRIKFSSKGGSDAWDAKYYLNIWVGNLAGGLAGYSSPVGGKPETDGVVIRHNYFGKTGAGDFGLGRTATHEIGHWLGLNHIWGDAMCGDDGVEDTPPQQSATNGCPSGTVVSCGNSGNMYMNFMDYTNDQCVYMFTYGQVNRMRKLFEPEGYRSEILHSAALAGPVIPESEIPGQHGEMNLKTWPNPVNGILNLQFANFEQSRGLKILILNSQGQEVYTDVISSAHQQIDMSVFCPGLYFITTTDRRKTFKIIRQ